MFEFELENEFNLWIPFVMIGTSARLTDKNLFICRKFIMDEGCIDVSLSRFEIKHGRNDDHEMKGGSSLEIVNPFVLSISSTETSLELFDATIGIPIALNAQVEDRTFMLGSLMTSSQCQDCPGEW